MLMKIRKKCILFQDEVLDCFQIWTTASSLNVKANEVIKKKFVFLINRSVFSNVVKNEGEETMPTLTHTHD